MHFTTPIVLFLFSFLNFTFPHPTRSNPSWTSLTSLPVPRREHTTVFLSPHNIAVLGGIIPTFSNDTLPITTTSLVQIYSISSNTWTAAAALLRAMNHINAAAVNGEIYVLGGLADSGETPTAWRGAGDSSVYSPISNKWIRIPNIPVGEARGSAAVAVYNNKIYLVGGMTDLVVAHNGSQNSVTVMSIFDTKEKRWLDVPHKAKYLPEARDHAGAAVVDGKMYVLGGRDQGQENVKDTVFVLDLCDLESGWSLSNARMPTPRGGVAAGIMGKKIYVFGGEGNQAVESGVFDQSEAYDTVRNTWTSVGKMRIPRHGTYAVGVGKKIYVPGGGVLQGGAPVADFDVFEH